MSAQTTNLYLFEDLADSGRTKELANGDLRALHTVADWIKTFVVRPHEDLGRAGPVCPFVPRALERRTLWLAAEKIADRSVSDVLQLMSDYRELLLRAPADGDDASYKAIVLVFTDLSADRARTRMDDDQVQSFKTRSYVEDGVVSGEFHARNEGSAIRNPSFRPFKSPVPFLLMRPAVVSDWMFFLDNGEWLGSWARRFGPSAAQALAETLRRTNWRRLDQSAFLSTYRWASSSFRRVGDRLMTRASIFLMTATFW